MKGNVNQVLALAAVSEADGAVSGKKEAEEDDKDIVADLPTKPILKSAILLLIKKQFMKSFYSLATTKRHGYCIFIASPGR